MKPPTHKQTTIFFVFIVLVSFDCKKPKHDPNSDNGLPPATQEGKGVFACKVNGQPWISRKGLGNIGAYLVSDTLVLGGSSRMDDNSIEDYAISLYSFAKIQKRYRLNDSNYAYALYRVVGSNRCLSDSSGFGGGGRKKSTDGLIVFTKIDTINKIIAGIFNFTISTERCGTLNVTDGRFDLKYN